MTVPRAPPQMETTSALFAGKTREKIKSTKNVRIERFIAAVLKAFGWREF
jgi:hypothetical protein